MKQIIIHESSKLGTFHFMHYGYHDTIYCNTPNFIYKYHDYHQYWYIVTPPIMTPLKSLISERHKALPKSCKCQFCNRFEAHERIDNIKDNSHPKS